MLIAEPGRADSDDVRETARQAAASGTVVAVDTAYASDRTSRAALPAWRQLMPEAQILDAVLTIATPPTGPTAPVKALVGWAPRYANARDGWIATATALDQR